MSRSMSQERRVALDSMKDLDDLDDNDDDSSPTTPIEPPPHPPLQMADNQPSQLGEEEVSKLVSTYRSHHLYTLAPSASPIRMCSFDMLLNCLSFLEDIKAYANLRTVCKAWTILAEHEALWKPMAFKHCQNKKTTSCSSSSATTTPQPAAEGKSLTAAESAVKTPSTKGQGGGGLPSTWVCRACGLIQVTARG